MTENRKVQDALGRYLADEPPMNLIVDTVLAVGRRRRLVRQVATAAFASVTIAGVAFGAYSGRQALLDAPVAGTDTAAAADGSPYLQGSGPVAVLIQSRVRAALPNASLSLYRIYPSDWNRNTALPPSQATNATDWQALYQVGGDKQHEFWTTVDVVPPGPLPTEAELRRTCRNLGSTTCSYVIRPDGSVVRRSTRRGSNGLWVRLVSHDRPGSRNTTVQERVKATSLQDALTKWTIPPTALEQLATDPKLVIPRPQIQPPLPTDR